MKNAAIIAIVTALCATPAQAADWSDVRPGTFVGARLTIGGNSGGRPRAALTVAPTVSRISHDGWTSTSIGEGLAVNFGPGSKPTLTLGGVRADMALGLHRNGNVNSEKTLGISTGGWVAIGVGTLLTAVAAAYVVKLNECTECDQ